MNFYTKVKALVHMARNLWTVKVAFNGCTVVHHARNAADAFEWAACYGLEHDVVILDFKRPYAARLAHRDGAWVAL